MMVDFQMEGEVCVGESPSTLKERNEKVEEEMKEIGELSFGERLAMGPDPYPEAFLEIWGQRVAEEEGKVFGGSDDDDDDDEVSVEPVVVEKGKGKFAKQMGSFLRKVCGRGRKG